MIIMKVHFTHISDRVTLISAGSVYVTEPTMKAMGQRDTHPALSLLLSTLSFLLLLVLPIGHVRI